MSEQRQSRAGFKSALDRLDGWVRGSGERMAGRHSRRGFIESVAVGAAALGILRHKQPEYDQACTLPAGCFGTVDINVCYTPWLVVAAEAGQSGVVLRKGPSFSAAPVTRTDGVTPTIIPVGGTFGRVSNRTGSVSGGCPDPGPRPSQNGFLWGYWVGFGRQGWMPYSVGGTTYAVGNTGWSGTLCGPAQKDFDCRKAKSACIEYVGCGGASVGSPTCSETYRPIVSVGSDLSEEKYYLRYGADSTTFAWLVPGDKIKRWGYKSGGTYNWSCVQVICADYAPNGCRGWVRSDALGSTTSTGGTACYPSVVCPSGSSGG